MIIDVVSDEVSYKSTKKKTENHLNLSLLRLVGITGLESVNILESR